MSQEQAMYEELEDLRQENKDLRAVLGSVWQLFEGDLEAVAPVLHAEIQAVLSDAPRPAAEPHE